MSRWLGRRQALFRAYRIYESIIERTGIIGLTIINTAKREEVLISLKNEKSTQGDQGAFQHNTKLPRI